MVDHSLPATCLNLAVSVAQGGSFETGALTGAVAAGSSLLMDSSGVMGHSGDGNPEYIAERTAVSAIAGGTASVLSGGKFANGAITGAFAQLYNAEGGAVALSRGFAPRVATRMAATAGLAATAAAMDGPLPFGDIIGGGLLIYDVVTVVSGYIYNNDAPDFVGTSSGELIPVPEGAEGPYPADNNKGIKYINGSGGGNGLHGNVTGVRIMDPTNPNPPSPGYPGGYVSYGNGKGGSWGQTVDPNTGNPVGKGSGWHIPLRKP